MEQNRIKTFKQAQQAAQALSGGKLLAIGTRRKRMLGFYAGKDGKRFIIVGQGKTWIAAFKEAARNIALRSEQLKTLVAQAESTITDDTEPKQLGATTEVKEQTP